MRQLPLMRCLDFCFGYDCLLWGIEKTVAFVGLNTDFVGALPTALMKPLSGSGARGMMLDTMNTYGADAFVSKLACIVQGSTDTTFIFWHFILVLLVLLKPAMHLRVV